MPSVLREMRVVLEHWQGRVPIVIVEPGTKTGVPVLTDNPKEVGADRIVNTLAAHTPVRRPVRRRRLRHLDEPRRGRARNGEFLGGALAPGIEISIDALAARARPAAKVELVRRARSSAENTVEALQSGVLYGFAGQVDGLVRRIIAELGGPLTAVVATGGLARGRRRRSPRRSPTTVPTSPCVGLRLVYERNT